MSVSQSLALVVEDPGPAMLPIGALGFAIVVIVVALIVVVRRARGTVGAGDASPTVDSLASARLVEVDDAVRAAGHALAAARFGVGIKPFVDSLTAAKGSLDRAFALRQESDVAEADPAARDSRARGILELCADADATLSAMTKDFDEVQQLASGAPQALARVLAESAAAKARVATSYAAVSARRSESDSTLDGTSLVALSAVAGNPIQAQRLLVFVGTAVSAATMGITKGDPVRTTDAVRSAQSAVAQVTQLLDAVDRVVMLGGWVSTAELLHAVEQFVDTRRGAVGVRARSRLAEARARMAAAEDPDVVADLVETALSLALDDVVRYELVPSGQSDDGSDAARLGGIAASPRGKRR